ncbi:MAG: alpha/beta fold hydrolase [Bacteroidetes bacterium]|nr:alpha/beta fold hydrolase [Bacteroidota bacterium]
MIILAGDIKVNYFEYGSKDGLPVVFIHGFPFNHRMWEPQIKEIPENIRAILYDVRGHGASSVGDGQFTIEMFVDDLIAMLDQLSIEKSVLCGLSMGGYIALRTAERHPERIKGLVLCDTKSGTDTDEEKVKRTSSMKAVKTYGVPAFADEFVKAVFWEKTFVTNPKVVEFIKEIIRSNSSLGICGTLLALASRTDTTKSLASTGIPACIIVGEHDMRTPVSVAREMQNAIPESELHIISDAGHMSNLENSEEFNKYLFAFLKKFKQ